MSTGALGVKIPEALAFLDFLDEAATAFDAPFAFQTYDDNKERKGPARTLIGSLDQHKAALAAANRDGYAVHITVNDTAGKARKGANVVKVRKHFVEIDGTMTRDKILKLASVAGLTVAWINESSPGKYHVYFNVADDVRNDLRGFTRRQKQLAALFGGGKESVDLSRVLRLPGFYHRKGKPFMVRCVHRNADAPAHSIADFAKALAGIEVDEAPEVERDAEHDEDQTAIDAAIEHFKTYPPAISDTENGPLKKKGNDTTLDAMMVAKDFGLDETTCLELGNEHYNVRCDPQWSYEELQAIVRNAYRYGKNAQGAKHPDVLAAKAYAADPLDNNAINAAIVADIAWRSRKSRLQSSAAAPVRGIGDNSGLVMVNLEDVKPRNVDFIWPGRLAKGKHTALAGEGGIGKSQITIDMMARVTKGLAWPDAKEIRAAGWAKELESAPKGYCIVLSAEDAADDTIVPRLIAAGGDPKFVKFVSMVKGNGGERKFSLQDDLTKLKDYCRKLTADTKVPVQLIVIDPASSYMGGAIDASKNTAVRSVLDPITRLAEDLQCAVVSITHFRKGTSPKAVDKVMDSVAFVNAPRCALACYLDPSDVGDFNNEGPSSGRNYVLLSIKTNLRGERAGGLSYRIEEVIGGDGLIDARNNTPIRTSRIVWQGKTDLTADQISQMETERGTPKLNEAIKWVREILPEDVPVLIAEVRERAEDDGIAPDTLKRAKRALRVKTLPPAEPGGPRSWVRPSGARTDIELDPFEAVEVVEVE